MVIFPNNTYFGVLEYKENAEAIGLRILPSECKGLHKFPIFCLFLKFPSKSSKIKTTQTRKAVSLNNLCNKLNGFETVYIYGDCTPEHWRRLSSLLSVILQCKSIKFITYVCDNANGISPFLVNGIDSRLELHSSELMGRRTAYRLTFTKTDNEEKYKILKPKKYKLKEVFYQISESDLLLFILEFNKD